MTGTRPTRLRAALCRRLPDGDDDRGSLTLALLLIIVGLALAAALLPTMIVQDRATVFDGSRTDNLAAAQAGIDVVIGRIRAATTTTTSGVGNPAALPCTASAATPPVVTPITGAVAGVGRATYSAVVTYYVFDPVANPGTPAMVCVSGSGTYDATTKAVVPGFAVITSTGTDGATSTNGASVSRTLTTTYVVKTSSANVLNGQIRIYPSGSSNWCMDVGSTTPTSGAPVTLKLCSTTTPPTQQQLFAYRSDLTLQLTTSITAGFPNGLCLDFNTTTTNPSAAPAAGNPIVLRGCNVLGSPPFSQQWSFNDHGEFQAALATSATTAPTATANGLANNLSTLCMAVGTQASGTPVQLASCDASNAAVTSPQQAWLPSPNVGPGAAAAPQLVNFQQFGRCFDIPQMGILNVPYQAYPCKQNPYPGAVSWNQKFTFSGTPGTATARATAGTITTTTTAGVTYCLTSPLTENGYPSLQLCSPIGTVAAQQWTEPGNTVYTAISQRFTIVDSSGLCLGISDSAATAPWSAISVNACSGSTAQKWNAAANTGSPVLQNTYER